MRKHRKFALAIILVVMGAAGVTFGEESVFNQLVRMQATYETELAKIKGDAGRKQEAQVQQYEKSLGLLEQSAQKAGVLEKLLAVRKEKERFSAGKQVEETDFCTAQPDLLKLQKDFSAMLAGLRLERARNIVSLAEKFAGSLGRLQTRLTQEGKVEEALTVKQQVTDLQKRPELTEARFIIAEVEAKKPVVVAPQPEVETVKEEPKKSAGSTAKMSKKDAEKSIRKRFVEYYGALADDDLEKALRYMDPGFVRLAGAAPIKASLVKVTVGLKTLKAAGIRFDVGRVDVDEKAGEGIAIPRYWANNKWEYSDPTYWIRLDGEWYVDCRERNKNIPADGQQPR